MAPKVNKASSVSNESLEEDVEDRRDWSPFESSGIFIKELGTQEVIEIEGRQADLFSTTGYNCTGRKFLLQAWGTYSWTFGDYMKMNHCPRGQVYVIPKASKFKPTDVCFRMKNATPFQRRHYEADYVYIYQVAEGEKMDFKKPPKMSGDSLPVPMGDWDSDVIYDVEYFETESEVNVKEEVCNPAEWCLKAKTRSSGIPASFLSSPVKKRSFAELAGMSSSSAANSPIKMEPGVSSSSSSSSSRSPLFASVKK